DLNQSNIYFNWPDGTQSTDSVKLDWNLSYIRRLFYEYFLGYDIFCIGRKLLVYKNKVRIKEYKFPNNILYLTILNDQIYIGLEKGGVKTFKVEKGIIMGPVQAFLNELTITSIIKDKQGGHWFSTHESGLFYMYPSSSLYENYDGAIAFIKKHKKYIYVGYQHGVIKIFEKSILHNRLQLPIGANNVLLNVTFDYNDSLIAITNKGLLHKFKSWKKVSSKDVNVLSITPDLAYGAPGNLAELHTYAGIDGKLLRKTPLPKRIIAFLQDVNRNLWIGTLEGLFLIQKDTLYDLRSQNNLFKDRIIDIKKKSDGSVVVASLSNGIAIIKDGKTTLLNSSNSKIPTIINSIEIDNNVVWAATNKGLSKITFSDSKRIINNFSIESGLPTADVHQFTVQQGWIYMNWLNKLVTIQEDQLSTPLLSERTYLTRFTVNGRLINFTEKNTFSYNDNDIELNYNSVNISAGSEQNYYYKLDGFDRNWHTTKARYVKYTNLPPGSYTFQVVGSNSEPFLKKNIAKFTFKIKQAFWQQPWFLIVCFLLILILILILFRIWSMSIKRKNQLLLDLTESQQTALVQLINPHFIFNILNIIQASILKEDKIMSAATLSKFAKLMRMSLEMSRQRFVSLEKEISLIRKYLELEHLRSSNSFTYQIEIDQQLDISQTCVPTMLIQPFVENSIKHGIMHLKKPGIVKISIKLIEKKMYCFIDDNGVGRIQSAKLNANIQSEHQSSGLAITLNRLKLLHKQNGTTYEYSVIDKINENEEPDGTTIIFTIPLTLMNESD
ncbi:MAG TPA: histidine kinase, partial [Chondromyces sp.]|nr:histidine kinase [Chondromyces sp.]